MRKIYYIEISFPIQVSKIKQIWLGDGFSLFLDNSGLIYFVGKNNKGQLRNNEARFIDGIKKNGMIKMAKNKW